MFIISCKVKKNHLTMQNIYQLLSFNKEVSPKRRMYPFFHTISYHQ